MPRLQLSAENRLPLQQDRTMWRKPFFKVNDKSQQRKLTCATQGQKHHRFSHSKKRKEIPRCSVLGRMCFARRLPYPAVWGPPRQSPTERASTGDEHGHTMGLGCRSWPTFEGELHFSTIWWFSASLIPQSCGEASLMEGRLLWQKGPQRASLSQFCGRGHQICSGVYCHRELI